MKLLLTISNAKWMQSNVFPSICASKVTIFVLERTIWKLIKEKSSLSKCNWKKNRKNNENLTKIGTFEEFLNEKQKKMWKIYNFCQFSTKNDEKWLKIYSEDSHFRDMRILPIPGNEVFFKKISTKNLWKTLKITEIHLIFMIFNAKSWKNPEIGSLCARFRGFFYNTSRPHCTLLKRTLFLWCRIIFYERPNLWEAR